MNDTESSPARLDLYDYQLPQELIAQEPLPVRHESRLLILDRQTGFVQHKRFSDILDFLKAGDILVVNNTKVIPARLLARRASGGIVKLQLIKPLAGKANLWEAMVTPIKRLKPGERLSLVGQEDPLGTALPDEDDSVTLKEIFSGPDGYKRLLVDLGEASKVWALLNRRGLAPLPPYIRRPTAVALPLSGQAAEAENKKDQAIEPATLAKETKNGASRPSNYADGAHSRRQDLDRYQTVYAATPGAVAAPTAGLHFSTDLLERLKAAGVQLAEITLHVGPGTFKPIESSVEDHTVEAETFSISQSTAQTINAALEEGRRIIAVGTTSVRALEAAGRAGHIEAVEDGSTSLYVKPGHNFKIVSAMVTNFHLSRSSLLVLVSAFAGRERILSTYQEAISQRYRFYSYGDAMLIL